MVVSAQKVRAAAAGGAGQWGGRGHSLDEAHLACEPWDEWPHYAALGLGSRCSKGTVWAEMAQEERHGALPSGTQGTRFRLRGHRR